MIKDRLENADTYYGISDLLKKGFEWLKSNNLKSIESGKYEIEGQDLYANIQEYTTKDDGKYETHRKYIDIQYMIRGQESVGVCQKKDCTVFEEYNAETDLEFMNCTVAEEWQTLNEGEFLVFFPNDAHKPSINPDSGQTNVKKVIVKVGIE